MHVVLTRAYNCMWKLCLDNNKKNIGSGSFVMRTYENNNCVLIYSYKKYEITVPLFSHTQKEFAVQLTHLYIESLTSLYED